MGLTAWEIAFLLLLFAIILGVGRLTQLRSGTATSTNQVRTAVRHEPVAAPPLVAPVICAACQATNVGTNKFCSVCGATLRAQTPTSAEPAALAEPAAPSGDVPSPLEGGPPSAAPATGPKEPGNTCPSCATVNPPGQPFCGQCGTRLSTAAA